jgi:hypothetical protein
MQAIERTTQPHSWALAAPLVCAIHCISAPLVVALLPAVAPSETTEWVLLAVAVVFGVWVLSQGTRQHGRVVLWIPATAGLMVWAMSLAALFEPLPEVVTTVAGSLLVAGAIYGNAHWSRNSEPGESPDGSDCKY